MGERMGKSLVARRTSDESTARRLLDLLDIPHDAEVSELSRALHHYRREIRKIPLESPTEVMGDFGPDGSRRP